MSEESLQKIRDMGEQFAGPVLYDFVRWVLQEAQKEKLTCLYFLARDGYILRQIAQKICEKLHISIECRYLYCSRLSFRMPSYHLIGEEAFDLLCLGGYYVTPKTLLERACLSHEEALSVLERLEGAVPGYDRPLSKITLASFTQQLKKNEIFRELVHKKSEAAYPAAISYLIQEGLFSQPRVAIIDSGWTGSMQRSLRQLMQSHGYKGSHIGFYFGMYARPEDPKDGIYHTWYFNADKRKKDKILFCNNLFECMLSAPHGMTTGYQDKEGLTTPIMQNSPASGELNRILAHQNGINSYVDRQIKLGKPPEEFSGKEAKERARKLLYRYMAHPKKKEAAAYGDLLFCDDVTEGYCSALASKEQVKYLSGYSIPRRVFRKLIHQSAKHSAPELFWSYGTIAFAPVYKRLWYRMNFYVWEWLRYTLT